MADPLLPCYDLIRRVEPSVIETALWNIIETKPELTDQLLQTVDVPLKTMEDPTSHEVFIKCDYNRDIDSYRSPSTSKYYPPLPDGQQPSKRLRQIEIQANQAFTSCTKLYSSEGICSVYLWDIEPGQFGFGCFIKNKVNTTLRGGQPVNGWIDCIDIIEVRESNKQATYKMTSSFLMSIEMGIGLDSPIKISGSSGTRSEKTCAVNNDIDHIVNCGELVENNSDKFRGILQHIIVQNVKRVHGIVSMNDVREDATTKAFRDEIMSKLRK
uniref:F-actin-capping protein subunit beta n=1 Tax=Coptotermes formosanus TaxID=36987 RepID=R4UW38_COPFO|nr:F-actin capping protein, beta subunit [Coptotermes formosanus]